MKELEVLESIKSRMDKLPGHLGFYYKNLLTGLEFGVGEDEAYLAASVIKFPLYLYVLSECEKGNMNRKDKLIVMTADKMPSCGALTLFTGDVEVDIATLCRLMIDISDNTATNKLINHCGIDNVNSFLREMGCKNTVLRRLLFDSILSAKGIQNTVCPKEIGGLLEKVYRGEFINEAVSAEVMDTLKKQQIDHKLNGRLCDAVPIAHKTGEDDNLSNDVGIIFAKEPFVICFTGHDTDVYPWEDLIRNAAWELVKVQEER